MLIEFRVSNYRSIEKTQVFSMVASKDNSLSNSNCVESGIAAIPSLLRSAVMYGPNASGKSSLIAAIAFMRSVVEVSAVGIREGQTFNIAPFRFTSECTEAPSEFEMTFMDNGVRYQYGFALTTSRITKEWLLAYPKSQPQRWFEREYDQEIKQYNWHFGSHLKPKQIIHSWKEQTRINALFLSTAVNLNSEQLRPIFNWFVNKLVVIAGNFQLDPAFTIKHISDEVEKSKALQLMQAADLGIHDIQIEMLKGKLTNFRFEAGIPIVHSMEETEAPKITLFHQAKDNVKVGFDFNEESHGTQRFFTYAGPILDVLKNGHILIVDELDSSLHSKMVRFLIGLFHKPELSNKAQLFFSTHNTSLLDTDLFRRDQIWFIEKDQDQSSHLYPLTDFSPRKDEALEKGYLAGRYGALPFFGEPGFQ